MSLTEYLSSINFPNLETIQVIYPHIAPETYSNSSDNYLHEAVNRTQSKYFKTIILIVMIITL